MTPVPTQRNDLIHHISRLEGQLQAAKRELSFDKPNCIKISTTLSAASRSFASLRRNVLQCFLEEKYLSRAQSSINKAEYDALLRIISS